MNERQRIVILTGPDLQHRYVASALADLANLTAIVVVQQPRLPLLRRLARARRRIWSVYWVRRSFPTASRYFGPPELTVTRPKHCCVTLVRIFSACTALISCLSLPFQSRVKSHLTLNLHTGVSPRYRGADCDFWPLHERELHLLGATVHTCTSDLDGGAIFGTAAARLEAEDGVGAVFGRCVVAGGDLYKRVVHDLITAREIKAIPQDLSAGKEYRVAMRGPLAELRVAGLIRRGLIRDHLNNQPRLCSSHEIVTSDLFGER
jgi:hypothetical protein